MKRYLRRVLSLLLCSATICSLLVIEVSAAVGGISAQDAESVVKTSTTTLTKQEWETYVTKIFGDIRTEIATCNSLLGSDQKDAGAVLASYAKIGLLMDWMTYNFYIEESVTDLSSGRAYTLFDMSKLFDGSRQDLQTEALEIEASVRDLYTRIQNNEGEVFEVTVDWSFGKFNEKHHLASLTDYSARIADTNQSMAMILSYHNTFTPIASNFIPGHLAAILIESEEELESLKSDTSTNGRDMMEKIDNILQIGDDRDKAAELYSRNKDKLAPYLELLNDLVAGYNTNKGIGLADCEIDGMKYTAYNFTSNDFRKRPIDICDDLTRLLWDIVYGDNSSDSTNHVNDLIQSIANVESALDLMSNCKIVNGAIVAPDEPELTKVGYVILAAGCTYDPFVSKACDDAYLSVVKEFLEDPNDQEKLQKILQVAVNTKKPLYVTTGSKSAWKDAGDLEAISSSDFDLATLQDVLDIDKNETKAYVMLKGQMTPSSVDASTFEYANYGTQNGETSNSTTSSVTITNPNATDSTVAANTTQGVITPDTALKTVGTNSLTATSQQTTVPVMITCGRAENIFTQDSSGFSAAVGGMTSVVIQNAAVDSKGCDALQRADRELLFVNGLGDIVLSDNTIILPAIANPLMFVYDDKFTGKIDKEFIDEFSLGTDYHAYYPYTATFMNHYPIAAVNRSEHLEVTSATDLNKFIICVEDSKLYAKRIKKVGESAKLTATGGVVVSTLAGNSFSVKSDENEIFSVLNIATGKAGFNWHNVTSGAFFAKVGTLAATGGYSGAAGGAAGGPVGAVGGAIIGATGGAAIGALEGTKNTLMITRGSALSGNQIPFFPLNTSAYDVGDSYVSVAGPLTTSAIRFISYPEEVSGTKKSSGRFRVSHYLVETCGEALLGTQYAETLDRTFQISYEDLVNDSVNRFTRFIINICENAIDNLGRIDGVLAIKGPYSNSFFNVVVRFVQQFYLLIAAALMIIVAAKFMKGHYNMIYVCFLGVMCIAGFEVYANWMPTLIPSAYNFAVNDSIEDVVWSTVIFQAEKYEETYRDSGHKDPATGYIKPYTATITLYTLTDKEMESVCLREGVSQEMLRSGTQIMIDSDAGIFIQGNKIKMSVDRLLANNSMRGLYQSQWEYLGEDVTGDTFIPPINEATNGNPYSIQLIQPYISLEAYYTPFDHIERSFMVNLNTFANIFRIERNQFPYNNGEIYKDAFLVQSFLHSAIFVDPGNEEFLMGNIVPKSVDGELDATADDILNLCKLYFNLDDPALRNDWLNLRSIFVEPDQGIQDSLWGRTMQNRGWYDNNWIITAEGAKQLSELIHYINSQTKMWVIRNEQQINYISDENAIKMISLYATTAFTHYVSQFGEWMYPNYINAAELELCDVLYGSMTTLRDRAHAYDGTVVNTVAVNNGVFGVIFLLLIVLFSTVFIFIITYLVPVLYALFGGILVFKLINDTESIGLVKGYVKVTGVTAILYFIFSLSLKLVKLGGYNWYGYLGCALVILLCLYFLFWVCLSVIQDAGELGNNTLSHNLLKGLDKITRGAVRKLTVNTTSLYQGAHYRVGRYGGMRPYGRSYSIDDYDNPVGSRAGYGRYNDYDTFGSNRSGFGGFSRHSRFGDEFGGPRRDFFGGRGRGVFSSRRGWRRNSESNSNVNAGDSGDFY